MLLDVLKIIIEIIKVVFSIFTYFKDRRHKKDEPSGATDGSSDVEN